MSTSYVNTDTKLSWQCADGHVWETTPAHIKRGQWCPICRGVAKKTIQDMQTIAAARGGRCLSKHYANNETHLIWECTKGHTWRAKPANVQTGTWCPVCAGQRQDISDLQSLAKSRGGKCLSDAYRGQARKHRWQCREGHEWDATPNSLKNGSWCPHCHIHYGEELCRLYFEALFKTPFPRSYPMFLKIGRRRFLQLDGYSEKLSIAFEHQGEQHYRRIKHFHRTELDFKRQVKRDGDKRELCKRHGIALIDIPHVPKMTPLSQLMQTIKAKCVNAGISVPADADRLKVDPNRAYNVSGLAILRSIAQSHGGKCLSGSYLGDRVKLRWRCTEGHEWEAMPNGIKNGTWCPHCYGNVEKNIEEVRRLATEKDFTLISTEYKGTNGRLVWQCKYGHQWKTTPKHIMHGTGCPRCAGNLIELADVKKFAESVGISVKSNEYVNNRKHMEFECGSKHIFKITWTRLKQYKDDACPECRKAKRVKERREEMYKRLQRIVSERAGLLISEEYVDARTKVLVKCAEGHEWWVIPGSIRRRSWCPQCDNG